jgi:hypothetical protein
MPNFPLRLVVSQIVVVAAKELEREKERKSEQHWSCCFVNLLMSKKLVLSGIVHSM